MASVCSSVLQIAPTRTLLNVSRISFAFHQKLNIFPTKYVVAFMRTHLVLARHKYQTLNMKYVKITCFPFNERHIRNYIQQKEREYQFSLL